MRPDRIAGLLVAGLTLAACSPEERPRDAVPEAPGAAEEAAEDGPAAKAVPPAETDPPERPATEPEARIDPDPQVGVELPEPPVRVPENPPTPG